MSVTPNVIGPRAWSLLRARSGFYRAIACKRYTIRRTNDVVLNL